MEKIMNDLELVDEYIEKCRRFVNPVLFREIQHRGLYDVINHLPDNVLEAKSVARGRLAKIGKSFGDNEIDQIANTIQRIETLRDTLKSMNMADADKVLPILSEMTSLSEYVRDYYK